MIHEMLHNILELDGFKGITDFCVWEEKIDGVCQNMTMREGVTVNEV